MLAPNSEADEPCRQSPKEVNSVEQPENEGHLVQHRFADHEWRQDTIVDRLLGSLDDPRWKHPSLLDLPKERIHVLSVSERGREDVCGRNGVLDRKVDSNSTNR